MARKMAFPAVSIALLLVCLLSAPVMALGDGDSDETDFPWTVSFTFENDLFADSDAQYTNGMRLSLISPDLRSLAEAPAAHRWLVGLVQQLDAFAEYPEGTRSRREYNVGIALGQKMFTPDNTATPVLQVLDRPYAGWLYGAISFVAKTQRRADMLELQGGIVGPESFAEDAQRFVHDIRDIPVPQGWDRQLKNEPGLLVYYEHKRRYVSDNAGAGVGWDAIPHLGLAIGNVTTYAAAGGELRFGWRLPDDFGTSLIRPGGDASAPSTRDAAAVWKRPLGAYVFAALAGRAVARDVFLDGNTFTDSHDVSREPLVGDLVIGASVYYRAAKLSFAQVFRTREFEGQDDRHRFGSITLSLSF